MLAFRLLDKWMLHFLDYVKNIWCNDAFTLYLFAEKQQRTHSPMAYKYLNTMSIEPYLLSFICEKLLDPF